MKKYIWIWMMAALIMTGCGSKQEVALNDEEDTIQDIDSLDHTIYGLACDGCNDTLVIFLKMPYNGGDPDTLHILDAVKKRRIMGKIHIGDKLAIMKSKSDSTVADLVIVTEQLMGQWRHLVYPTLHQRADMEGNTERQKIAQLPDSIKELLNIPHEYGMDIKHDNLLYVPGAYTKNVTSDEESPIEYPKAEYYNEWNIYIGRFVMLAASKDSLGETQIVASDTADIIYLMGDSLVLQFNDGPKGYYRKVEVPKE